MFSPGPRRRRSCDGSLENEGVWRSAFGVRGAALARTRGLAYFCPVRGRLKHRVKQAAPGNYLGRFFVQRPVRLFNCTHAQQTNTRWDVPGSRLLKKICGQRRAERNRARSLGCDPKRLPPVAERRTPTRPPRPFAQRTLHLAGS